MNDARASEFRASAFRGSAFARAVLTITSLAVLTAANAAWGAWQTFGPPDGFAARQVQAIAEDQSGAMWIGTTLGVSRYDGVSFKNLTSADGIANVAVNAISTDRAGDVWFGTVGGVSQFDGTSWKTYTATDGLSFLDVSAVLEDRHGVHWFGTHGGGVNWFDGVNWGTYRQAAGGLVANDVSCILEDHAGNLWFGTLGGGVSRFDGSTWSTYTAAQGLSNNFVKSILETHDGTMWFGTQDGGVSRLQNGSWRTFATAGGIPLGTVTSLREDHAGLVWAGFSSGVARFDGISWRAYTANDGLASNSVYALTIDSCGNLWVGTDNGLSRYDGESFTSYSTAFGGFFVQAMLEDRTGSVWCGTSGVGVVQYDRATWANFSASPGALLHNRVNAVVEDSTGALWFGTAGGASRYSGGAWQNYTNASTAGGLVGNNILAMARDSADQIWVGTTTGLNSFNGSVWTPYTSPGSLPASKVLSLAVDAAGAVWCGTIGGVSRFDGSAWTTYSSPAQLPDTNVNAILQDHTGAMWFGTPAGLSRFDGGAWTIYRPSPNGLPDAAVTCLAEDRDGVLWVGTLGSGVSRFDGTNWNRYSTTDGLPDGMVKAAIVEHSGNLWFGVTGAAVLYEPDRVPPQTVITSPAPALSASRLQTVRYVAAYREVVGIEFSTSLDNAPWPDVWTSDDARVMSNLSDGTHTLQVRARDRLRHVDPTPASCTFEVDATPPVPVVTSPYFRQPVRDTLVVTGSAADARFRSLRVETRAVGAAAWDSIAQSSTPVANGVLARLATKALPDGDYDLRVSVADTLGLTGVAQVTFIVDNQPPWANETTPALISADAGGDVYTTQREAHLFIPPHALERDAVVRLDALDAVAVPDTMPDGASRVAPGFAVSLASVPISKTATLGLGVAALTVPAGATLALYEDSGDGVWRRLGGTVAAGSPYIEAPISGAGRYAIAARSSASTVPGAALALSLTPRVFSARGGLTGPDVGIGFVLARSGEVRVTVHNRAGRLVRTVLSGTTLGAGANLVHWDGRDADRRDVEEGLYLVTVEALGERQVRPLAVVR